MPTSLLQGSRKVGQGDTKANHRIILFPYDQRYQIITQHRDIHIDIIIDLLLGQSCETIQGSESRVQCMEYRTGVRHNLLSVLELQHLQSVFLLHDLTDTQMLLRNAIRYIDLKFMPILILSVSDTLHLLGVIGIIINRSHRTDLIETLDQHTLVIHIGKAHRTVDLLHALFAGPFLDSAKKGINHLVIINKIYETKAGTFLSPSLVTRVIHHTAYHLPVLIGKEVNSVAHLERRIFLLIQRHHLFLY